MSTWPPVESKIKLPADVSTVLAALPTRTLFAVRDVAEATPKTGVTRVGDVANTLTPVPVLSVRADAKLADDGVIKNAVTPTPVPVTLPTGIVQFVRVPEEGVPKTGVTRVGDVANTKDPVPVSSVTAVIKLAEDGVAKNAVIPTPVPVTLPTGILQLVRVPEDGVPKAGVTRTGEVANTKDPVPVSSVTAVIKLAEDGVAKNAVIPTPVPVTLPTGIVQFVRVPEEGVPKTGVTRVGVLANTKDPVPVSSVTAVIKLAEDGVVKNVATPIPKLATDAIGYPVQLVKVPEPGVPNTGVMKVGVLLKTNRPVPVSSDITPANSDDEVAACTDNLSVVTTSVLLVGIVVVLIVPETVALVYTRVFVFGL